MRLLLLYNGYVIIFFGEATAKLKEDISELPYVGKFWSGKKLANLANCGLFANILPANNFFSKYKIISVTEIQSALLLTIVKTLTQ